MRQALQFLRVLANKPVHLPPMPQPLATEAESLHSNVFMPIALAEMHQSVGFGHVWLYKGFPGSIFMEVHTRASAWNVINVRAARRSKDRIRRGSLQAKGRG